ncbi:MAG: hypothetical protein KYX66_18850 [Blastomonas fulva]|uniref:hypothetical protein n=1 Tax=Blastomonas fulva TaxID=1550728 RepID=UPI0024E1F67F|nr:hypothetical protein [Blastomonas fulva]MDK2758788.1 hypothetical protein [Blastomonas fulva]
MSMVGKDKLASIERVRIEADRLTLACSEICGAVPIALGVAFGSSVGKAMPRDIQRELKRT